jgi:trimeric autotransporter adhesin
LVTNGTTFSNTTGWTSNTATVSVSGGELVVAGTASSAANQSAAFTPITGVTPGEVYVLTFDITEKVAASGAAGITIGGAKIKKNSDLHYWYPNNVGTHTTDLVATGTAITLNMHAGTNVGVITKFDNISLRRAEPDRTHNNNSLKVFGTITKEAVSTGSELVRYSGFSSTNYLEADLTSLGTDLSDLMISCWVRSGTSGSEIIWGLNISNVFSGGTDSIGLTKGWSGYWAERRLNIAYNVVGNKITEEWQQIVITRNAEGTRMFVDGIHTGTAYAASTLNAVNTLRIGCATDGTGGYGGEIALFKISKSIPTDTKINQIFRSERDLFSTNSAATLYSTDSNVTALAQDEVTGALHVGTGAGRSVFQGLSRVDSTTDAVGQTISANNGLVAED